MYRAFPVMPDTFLFKALMLMTSPFLSAACGTGFIFIMSVLGAAVVFFFAGEIRLRVQEVFMGFAAGVMLAAAVWSLLLPSMELSSRMLPLPCWFPAAVGILAGCLFLSSLDAFLRRRNFGESFASPANALLVAAITLHNIPEGMAVGLAFALAADGDSFAAASALALGIGIQNFPEGAAVSMPMLSAGMSRRRAFSIGVLSGAVEPVFGLLAVAAAAYAEFLMPWLLGFAAGAMLYVCARELIPAAKGSGGMAGFIGGFMLMMILDVALG